MTKIWYGNFENIVFLNAKNGFKKGLGGISLGEFFHGKFILLSNHTVFLGQFEIYLHLRVFQKAEPALAEAARAISAF